MCRGRYHAPEPGSGRGESSHIDQLILLNRLARLLYDGGCSVLARNGVGSVKCNVPNRVPQSVRFLSTLKL